MQLTEHFALHEFRCPCGECPEIKPEMSLLIVLEHARKRFGNRPVTINSGLRCPAYNAKIGGAPDSRHLYGDAADIAIDKINPMHVAGWFIEQPYANLLGVGQYPTHTHIDVRGYKARW